MNFEIKSIGGTTEYDFKIDDSSIKIVDFLQKIISEMKLEKIPFTLLWKTNIIGSKNNEEMLSTFFSEETNIILTIIKSAKIPKCWYRIECLIYYINTLTTSIDDYLLYLYNIYINYENKSNNNTLCHIKNINFIIFYYKKMSKLPRNCSPNKIYNNKQFIMYLVDYNPHNLRYASNELQDDEEIVMLALKKSRYIDILKYVSKNLQNNKNIILFAVQINGINLKYASKELQNDKEIVITAIQNNLSALQYASKELQNDKKIIMIVISINVYLLQFVSEEFKNDKEIVTFAVKKSGCVLQYASHNLRNDKDFLLSFLKENPSLISYISDDLRNNKTFLLPLLKINKNINAIEIIQNLSNNLINDKEIVKYLIKKDGNALQYVSEDLQNNREIVMTAVKKNGCSIKYASDSLRHDRKIIMTAIKNNPFALLNIPLSLRQEFINMCII
jgi:hypothetical protein